MIWKEKASAATVTPHEPFAAAFISAAFSRPSLPLLALSSRLVSVLMSMAATSSGVGHLFRKAFELSPKISENWTGTVLWTSGIELMSALPLIFHGR